MPNTLAAGFAEPVFDAQRIFRTVLTALSRPGLVQSLAIELSPPQPLSRELAAIALALADHDAPLWLDAPLSAAAIVKEYLRFHTGARIVDDPAEAAFALISDVASLPPLTAFAQGSDEYPDRSTTLVVAVAKLGDSATLRLHGPGIKEAVDFGATGLPADLPARLAANHALFPRGVDMVFVAPGQLVAIPRSSAIARAA